MLVPRLRAIPSFEETGNPEATASGFFVLRSQGSQFGTLPWQTVRSAFEATRRRAPAGRGSADRGTARAGAARRSRRWRRTRSCSSSTRGCSPALGDGIDRADRRGQRGHPRVRGHRLRHRRAAGRQHAGQPELTAGRTSPACGRYLWQGVWFALGYSRAGAAGAAVRARGCSRCSGTSRQLAAHGGAVPPDRRSAARVLKLVGDGVGAVPARRSNRPGPWCWSRPSSACASTSLAAWVADLRPLRLPADGRGRRGVGAERRRRRRDARR